QHGYSEFYRDAQDHYIELKALIDGLESTFWTWRQEVDKVSVSLPPLESLMLQLESLRNQVAELHAALIESFRPAFAAEIRRHEITKSVSLQDHDQTQRLPYDQLAWNRFKRDVATKLMSSFRAICDGLQALHIPEESEAPDADFAAITGSVADTKDNLNRIETLIGGKH